MIPIDSGKNHRNNAANQKMKSTFQENQKHHFILNSDKFFAVQLTFLIYAFRQLRTLFWVDKMDNAVDRHVFYISDGTAITAEVLGHAVMSQFPVSINSITLPFVENESRAKAVKTRSTPFTSRPVFVRWCSIPL